MKIDDAAKKTALANRLKRVEGQLRGVRAMIERGDDCADIAVQLSACRSAIQQTLPAFVACAVEESGKGSDDAAKPGEISRLLKLIA